MKPSAAIAPETEGEVYDRLQALIAECGLIARAVDVGTAKLLVEAQTSTLAALNLWMSQ